MALVGLVAQVPVPGVQARQQHGGVRLLPRTVAHVTRGLGLRMLYAFTGAAMVFVASWLNSACAPATPAPPALAQVANRHIEFEDVGRVRCYFWNDRSGSPFCMNQP